MSLTDKLETLLAGPLMMAATLTAAAEVWRRRSDRISGHDASDLESDDQARAHLASAVAELTELVFRATADEVAIAEVDPADAGAYVLRFDSVLGLNRAASVLEDAHRRLLTLYPGDGEDLIEQVRLAAASCRTALDDDGVMPVDDVRAVVRAIEAELSP